MADTITFPMSIVLIGTMIGGIGGFVLARQAWANKEVPGARSFSSLMLAITGWCLFSLLLVTSSNHSRAISWATLVGLCVTLVPFFWLTFVLEYTGRSNWLTSKTLPLIWAEPVAYILFTLVDLGYGFTNESARVSSIGGLTVVSVSHTPSFYFHLVYLFVVVLTGFAFLLVFLMQVDRLYRKQTTAILFAGLLPLVGTVSFSFAFPDFVLGVTPVFFAGGGVLVGLALFRYDFLDVIPLAAEVVLDEMDDPVIVVDNQRVLDFNEAAATLFESSNVIGCELETVVPGLLEAVSANESFSPSLVRTDGGAVRETPVYDPQRTSIRDHHGISRGEIYVLREITVQKRREETLRALQSATQRFMDAEHREEIAEIAVETADEVLDHPHSLVVFPEDDGTVLRSAALTDSIARRIRGDMVFPRKPGPMWEVFDSGEPGIHESISELTDVRYAKLPIGCLLLVPLGEHGVLGVGSDEEKRAFDADNRRFANILATTTETALDRAQREAELRMSQRTVEERTEQIEFFNGVLRHDILNGMTVINGNLELLGDHVDEEGQPLLETVQSWSEDIGQLTQKVRSVSQTVTDSESVMLTNRSLSKTLAKKTKKIQHTYPDINLQTDIEDGLRVSANELLGEVLENVLLNAIEHNDRDVPSLAVRACHSDGEVRVEIEDDGPGIPDEMKSQMFDQHVTSETSGSIGFGLYFVHVMMEQFGGNVWFEDTDTRGVVAILTFPTATPDIKNG